MVIAELGRILILDDEAELMASLCEALIKHGYEASGFASAPQALRAIQKQSFDILLLDLMIPEMNGIEFLKKALEIDPHTVAIIMTGYGTVQTAVEAMKVGAVDYILKPFKINMLLQMLSRAMEVRRLRNENLQLRDSIAIYDLIMAASLTLDIDINLNKIADTVLLLCEADEMSILLPAGADELYVAIVRGQDRDFLLGKRIPKQNSIAGWVVSQRETLLLQGEVDDPRFAPVKPRPEIKASVSMPLLFSNSCVGVLNVNLKRKNSFPAGKIKALNILACTAAGALENARLYSELKETEQKYRSIFENAIEGIFQVSREGRYNFVNPSMARILGYDKPDQLLSLVADMNYDRLLDGKTKKQCIEHQIQRRDGVMVWVSENVRAVRDDKGSVLYFEGTVLDITNRKLAENALRESEEKFSKAFHGSPIMMVITSIEDGNLIDANAAFCAALGYTREEILGRTVREMHFYADPEKEREKMQILMDQGRIENAEIEFNTRYGEIRYCLCWSQLLTLDTQVCELTACIDITDQKAMQEEFARLDRLNLIGEMAASIGHEIRNPMTAIRGFLQLLSSKDHYAKDSIYFDLMIEELDRANAIISEYLGMAKGKAIELKPICLDSIINTLYPIIKADANYLDMDIKLDLGQAPTLLIDEKEIRQMILNLVRNGLEAMSPHGTLTIGTMAAEEEVVLFVKDQGHGLDPTVLDKLGTPFLTTKDKGTGLGLAVCYSIANRHNARIKVQTGAQGTTFSVHFGHTTDDQMSLF